MLRAHCQTIGRDYDEIEKTVMLPVDLGPSGENTGALLERLRELAALAVSHAHCRMPDVSSITPLEICGERVIPVAAGF